MNILYFQKDNGGCQYYRAMIPLDMLHEQKLASVMRVNPADDPERLADGLLSSDVVLYPRVIASEKWLDTVKLLKSDGKLVVTDFDDWLWSVNPLSPHYYDYGLEDYSVLHEGKVLDVWKDGEKGFSIERNRRALERTKQAIEQCDLVTTTTEQLAEKLRTINKNVAVLPNCIDFDRWAPLPLKPHDDLRLFWAGGHSHYEDLQILIPVMPAVMQRFPRLQFYVMGYAFGAVLKDLPQDRVHFHGWEDNLSYPLRCAILNADISLVPLVDNEFNRCKSPLKWIEQAALGIPSVMSGVTPYKEMYNGKNALMVSDNSPEGWIEAISTLVRDPLLRARIGGEAQRYVQYRYDIRKRAKDWLAVYEANKKEPIVHEEKELEIEVTPCP